jgi:hypothetical protein
MKRVVATCLGTLLPGAAGLLILYQAVDSPTRAG